MFEKEAEEWVKENMDCCKTDNSVNQSIPYFDEEERCCAKSAFQDGAEFGYKKGLKAKINVTTISDCPIKDEWHYPSKGELPNCTRQVLICYGMEERMKFVYWRADLGTFGSALPVEITAWRYIESPKEQKK